MMTALDARGFTLIELLVTLAIFVILVTFAVPSFQQTIRNNRVVTETNTLVSGLQLARSEAVKRGVVVSLTADGSDFGDGYCVHSGGATQNCANSTPVRRYEAPQSSVSASVTQLAFNRLGELEAGASIVLSVAEQNCPSGKVDAVRDIRVGLGGQVTVSRSNCP